MAISWSGGEYLTQSINNQTAKTSNSGAVSHSGGTNILNTKVDTYITKK